MGDGGHVQVSTPSAHNRPPLIWQPHHLWQLPEAKRLAHTVTITLPRLHDGRQRLGKATSSNGACLFETPLILSGYGATPHLAFLWDHIVAGRPLLPAAAMVDAAASAVTMLVLPDFGFTMLDLKIAAPLLLPGIGSRDRAKLNSSAMRGGLVLRCAVSLGSGLVQLSSASPSSSASGDSGAMRPVRSAVVHMTTSIALFPPAPYGLAASTSAALKDHPPAIKGESHRAILSLIRSFLSTRQGDTAGASGLATISRPVESELSSGAVPCGGFVFHPSSLDCCLQLGAATDSSARGVLTVSHPIARVPTSAGSVIVPSLLSKSLPASPSAHEGEEHWSSVSSPSFSAAREAPRAHPGDPVSDAPSSLILDYRLLNGHDLAAPEVCSITGLTASPIRLKPHGHHLSDQEAVKGHQGPSKWDRANHQQLPEADPVNDEGILYETQYLAAEPQGPQGGVDQRDALRDDLSFFPLPGRRCHSGTPAAAGYLSAFQGLFGASALQAGRNKRQPRPSSSVHVRSSAGRCITMTPCAVATWEGQENSITGGIVLGMAKAAALEASGGAGRDSASVISHTDPYLAAGADGFQRIQDSFSLPKASSEPNQEVTTRNPSSGYNIGVGGVEFCPVLLRLKDPMSTESRQVPGAQMGQSGFRLVPRPPGSLGSLVPEPVPPPKGNNFDGVSVRVRAVGLNFRDLLVVSQNLKSNKIYDE